MSDSDVDIAVIMAFNRTLHFSDQFVISCGTVPVDVSHSLVLTIYQRKTAEYQLPKGRKNIGETMEQAAMRETFKETGYHARSLRLPVTTLATSSKVGATSSLRNAGGQYTVEPVAVTQRFTSEHVLKIIFWYGALVDSSDLRATNVAEEGEDFDSIWMPLDEVTKRLSYEDDWRVVSRVLEAVALLRDDTSISV